MEIVIGIVRACGVEFWESKMLVLIIWVLAFLTNVALLALLASHHG